MSVTFRFAAVVCASTVFIGALSFMPRSAQADKAGDAAAAAGKAVEAAELAEQKCQEAFAKRDEAAQAANEAAKKASEAAKNATTDKEKAAAKALEKKAQEASDKRSAADWAVTEKCVAAKKAWKDAEAAIKKAEELLKEKTDRGGVDDDELGKKLKGLKERLPKKPEQADVIPPSGGQTAESQTANGLHTVIFNTTPGKIKVNLPDDMRAGDTISGTVVAEPKGSAEEERKNNAPKLSEFKLTFGSQFPKDTKELMIFVTPRIIIRDDVDPAPSSSGNFTTKLPDTFNYTIGGTAPRTDEATVTITINSMVWFINNQPTTSPSTESPSSTNDFRFQDMIQQGRNGEVIAPPGGMKFDGNFANTKLMYGPLGSSVQDFEKNTENVSGGFGLIRPLAESPRKVVFESPAKVTGPMKIFVKEGDHAATGTSRNVGVALSAPKTNLMRGEKTTVTIEVRGLEGITKDVPLQLDSKGVITMEGGNFQNLSIKPQEVKPDGRYTTTRAITGQQAGGFTVTAMVIVMPFDVCLRDDTNPAVMLQLSTFTGAYAFTGSNTTNLAQEPSFTFGNKPMVSDTVNPGITRPGGTVQPGGTTQPGGTVQPGGTTQPGGTGPPPIQPSGVTLTGIGRPAMKGCIITLSHNAPDRRVFARLDACTKTGEASVQTNSPKTDIKITDKNTADNTAGSPPPK